MRLLRVIHKPQESAFFWHDGREKQMLSRDENVNRDTIPALT